MLAKRKFQNIIHQVPMELTRRLEMSSAYTSDACTTLLMKKMLASSEHYMSALGQPLYRKHSVAITPFYIREN